MVQRARDRRHVTRVPHATGAERAQSGERARYLDACAESVHQRSSLQQVRLKSTPLLYFLHMTVIAERIMFEHESANISIDTSVYHTCNHIYPKDKTKVN